MHPNSLQIKQRAQPKPCRVIGCKDYGNLAPLCKYHERAQAWYGSEYSVQGLPFSTLDSGVNTGNTWVKANSDNATLLLVLDRIEAKMNRFDILPFKNWKGKSNTWKADRTWAHLKPVLTPSFLVVRWIAVTSAYLRPTQPIKSERYHRCQLTQQVRKHITRSFPIVKTKRFITLEDGTPGIEPALDRRYQQVQGFYSWTFGRQWHDLCLPLLPEVHAIKKHESRWEWLDHNRGRQPK